MTTAHHDPHAFKAPQTSAEFNRPLGQLDAAIALVMTYGSGVTAPLTAQALAGQATLALNSAGFTPGMSIFIGDPGGTYEVRTVNTVPNGISLTVTANLTNTYAAGKPVSASPAELVDARGGQTSLGTRLSLFDRWAFDVRKYGAVGNGTTDDTTAIQAAIDAAFAAGGGVVYLPPGTYKTIAALNLKTGVILAGAGEVTIILTTSTSASDYAVRSLGTVAAGHALLANAVRGAVTVTTSAGGGASYATGDLVVVQSEAQALEAVGHKKADIYRVRSVAGDVVTLDGALLDSYATADTAKIRKVTAIERCGVRDLRIQNTRWTTAITTPTGPLLGFELSADVFAHNVTLEQNNGMGVAIASVYGARVEASRIEDLRDDIANTIYGYGVAVGYASRQVTVDGNTIRRCRHGFTTDTSAATSMPNYGVPRGISVTDNSIADTTHAGIDTHEDVDGIAIVGNSITACDYMGIQMRGYRSTIVGNTIFGIRGVGIYLDTSAEMSIVSGNSIVACVLNPTAGGGYGIQVASSALVTGNYCAENAADGIYVSAVVAGVTLQGNQCQNNSQSAAGTFSGIQVASNISRCTIVGNTCIDTQAVKTQAYGLAFTAAFANILGQVIVDGNNFSLNLTGPYLNSGTGLPVFGSNSPAFAPGHRQTKRGVTTGSIAGGGNADVVVTWPYSFSDVLYTAFASVTEATGALYVRAIKAKAGGTITVNVFNPSGGALTGAVDGTAIHD